MSSTNQPIRFYIETFGCQMNVADSEEMGRAFLERGLSPSSKADADVVVVNTCTVRQQAEQRALSMMGRLKMWKKERAGRKIIVAGCAAERLKKNLKRRFPQVDLVVGARSLQDFPALIAPLFKAPHPARGSFDWFKESARAFGQGRLRAEGEPFKLGDAETAFVTIMRGCNYSCSYCVVPAVRGRESYRPAQKILDEVKERVSAASGEVMLLGQTVNSYWSREGSGLVDFAELLARVHELDAVKKIRFMSPHPHYMSAALIQTIGRLPKISGEIHLPAQSGSNRILAAMKRNYTRERFIEIVRELRRARPGLAVTTDFIVGFPGETERDFAETLSLMEAAELNGAYCFKYSPRAGTESAETLVDDVPQEAKEERLARLLEATEKMRTRRKQTAQQRKALTA